LPVATMGTGTGTGGDRMLSNGAAIATPIVAALALAVWISMCFWADAHPVHKGTRKNLPYEVSGGAFEARDGGRQLMPVPERRPMPTGAEGGATASVPTQRQAPGATAATRASDTESSEEASPELVPGSAIRLALAPVSRRAAGWVRSRPPKSRKASPATGRDHRRSCTRPGRREACRAAATRGRVCQLERSQVLLKAPPLLIELVESFSAPLLSTMMIWTGLCEPRDVPLADEVE
jgi:hypothetical protein